MASVIDGDMIMVTISDDEDDAVVGNPGIEESRKSNGSANLPTPPPAIPTVLNNENGRPTSVPIEVNASSRNRNASDGRRSAQPVGASSLHYQFPMQPLNQTRRDSTASSSSLPAITLPRAAILPNENRSVDFFMHQINAGRKIACMLCGETFLEHALLKHVGEAHFFAYRPFKCSQCDYRAGEPDILTLAHLIDTGHVNGVENIAVIGERNQNVELVIRVIYEHSMLAHGKSEQDKQIIVGRLVAATRAMRSRRLQPVQQLDGDEGIDEFEESDDGSADAVSIPLPSPSLSDIDAVTPKSSATSGDESRSTSASSLVEALMPVPVTHRQARKIIQQPRSASAAPAVPLQELPTGAGPEAMDIAEPVGNGLDDDSASNRTGSFDAQDSAASEDADVGPPTLTPGVDQEHTSYSPPLVLVPEINKQEVATGSGAVAADSLPIAASSPDIKIQISRFTCGICQTLCYNLTHLQQHCKEHTAGYIRFKCDLQPDCAYGTWRERDMRSHAAKVHGAQSVKISMVVPTPDQKAQMQTVLDSFRAKGLAEPEEIVRVLAGNP